MFPCTSASKYVFISSSIMSFQQQDIMKGFYEWAMLFTGHVHYSYGTSLHVMAFKIRSIVPAVQVKYCWLEHAEALEWMFLDSLRNLKTRLLWQWCQDDELPEESHQLCLVLSLFCFHSCAGWLRSVFRLIANQREHPSGKVRVAQLWSLRPSTVMITGPELAFILCSEVWSKYSVLYFLTCKPLATYYTWNLLTMGVQVMVTQCCTFALGSNWSLFPAVFQDH